MKTRPRLDSGQIEVMDDTMAEILRQKSPAGRIRMAFNLWISTQVMLMTHLTKTHPDWDAKKVESEVGRRLSHGAISAASDKRRTYPGLHRSLSTR